MKANVQKSIQSLHSFWCHFSGGSIAALPLLSFFKIVMVSSLLCATLVSAQQGDTNRQVVEEKRLDLLYDKIMQTMSSDLRERFDSAATFSGERKAPVNRTEGNRSAPLTSTHNDAALKARMNELPDDLKLQVERAITEIQKRNEERKAQFRESRKNR